MSSFHFILAMSKKSKTILLCFTISSILFGSCGKNKNQLSIDDDHITISIDDYTDKTIRFSDFIARVDTIELHTKQNFMGSILDFCLSDSGVYIVDMTNAVWAFKYPSGELIKRIQRTGHGNGEYIMLRAITSRDGIVYLSDIGAGKILLCDGMLNYKKSIKLDFPVLDFAKTENGFLFCNAATTDDLNRLVYTDENGKLINSYLPSEMELDLLSGERTFTENKDGEVFFNAPYSNDVYKWTKNGPILAYQTDYGEKRLEESVKKSSEIAKSKQAYNATFFVSGNLFINSFIQNNMRYYSFCQTDSHKSLQGFVDTTECILFYPTAQYKDALAGIVNTDDWDKWKPQKDSCDATLFVFHLKSCN